MKKFIVNFSLVLTISIVFCTLLWYFLVFAKKNDILSVSPLPDFLSLNKNGQVRFLDLWSPIISDTTGDLFDVQNLTAKSVLVYDLNTNKTIFEKSARVRRPMASLTKIMTAIISLENKKQNDRYVVIGADLVGENSMGLKSGEILSHQDLLYGLMLPSGNDASEVLARNHPMGRVGFINAMNEKAKSLGLKDTQFDNPSGLQGDGVQHTTAYDLLVITKYALDNFPEFRKVISSAEYSIPETDNHTAYELYNETNLLTTYEGVKGVKTGYTPEAGLCLVTYIDYGGHQIIGIILNSENRRGEMKELLDYSLKSLGVDPPVYKG